MQMTYLLTRKFSWFEPMTTRTEPGGSSKFSMLFLKLLRYLLTRQVGWEE